MKRYPNIPVAPGTFVLLHAKSSTAYVGECKNLRHRATIWAHHFGRGHGDPKYHFPVHNMPRHAADEWTFIAQPATSPEDVRKALLAKGVTIINKASRKREIYLVGGVEGSLMAHCRTRGVSYPQAYKRLSKGYTVLQALGIDPIEETKDPRDHAVALMPVKIVGSTGGFLSYDEAQLERPELGNIRAKLFKFRKQNPEATEIKLEDMSP